MRVIAIIQARMGSSRLPGKVLSDIFGRPMLEWVVERVKLSKVSEVVIATTSSEQDDQLAGWCLSKGYKVFRGSEFDVLGRFYECARNYSAQVIVRITADDPLKDPSIINQAIDVFFNKQVDYCSNTLHPSYPEGLDVEVFSFQSLERANKDARLNSEREHVTPYIWKNASLFNIGEFFFDQNLSEWRWTVDKTDDLEFINDLLIASNADIDVSYIELIGKLNQSPSLLSRCLNRTIRNEGYLKSIQQDENT